MNSNDNCAGAVCEKGPSLRERIGEITEILIAASNNLADAEIKLYISEPQKDCCNNGAPPCGDSLEYYIGQLGQLACVVRNRAMEVNSRI